MNKNVLLSAVLSAGVLFFMGIDSVHAYGSAGCGIGSMIIKDRGPIQILAATTNGISSNQTIGMTFGVSNCPAGDALLPASSADVKEQEVFVAINFDALEQEMAAGQGEKLNAFSELLGCKDKRAFGQMSQKNWGKFFAADDTTTPAELLGAVRGEVLVEGGKTCKL